MRWTTNDIRLLCMLTVSTEPAEVRCQGCQRSMREGPTQQDHERYAKRMCGACVEIRSRP